MNWYVLYTRHQHERAVYARLQEKGFQTYLPLTPIWRYGKAGRRRAMVPLFPRHIFVRCYLEMYTHLELITTPGVIRLLEDAQGQLLIMPEGEMRTLQRLGETGVPLERITSLPEGEQVQILEGPLRGITGVMQEGSSTLLVPIFTLGESVAVAVDRSQVKPNAEMQRVGSPGPASKR